MKLHEHETANIEGGITFINFRREFHQKPGKYHEQHDTLPLTSQTDDPRTFITPRTVPIPTKFFGPAFYEPWGLSKISGIWSRGGVAWGPPSFILRVFTFDGKYEKLLHCGKNWNSFDEFVTNFDLNNKEMTDWTEADETEIPWNAKERVLLRGWVNDTIEEKGLIWWITNLRWADQVLAFNMASKKCETGGPWRTEASILECFSTEVEIFKAAVHAGTLEMRVKTGDEVSWDEDHPKDFIPVNAGLEGVVEPKAEEPVSVENPKDDELPEMEE
ncbi:hypothetical protein EK21DRAFT_105830 [Setomelanomma holmii]|uniref:Uncharacterized protein n=1 Tax=Setomelanomma holmii TaxID=210430 RepID=A0A9P4LU68_9PLEO|nr:hypothetical protein EK21DRAFT_105830 [Setomelanomma holmii]